VKNILYGLAAISLGCFIGGVVFGPTAYRLGVESANEVIEASACGDSNGVVAEGWEERCSERAASNQATQSGSE
jgi:hypothetical protein